MPLKLIAPLMKTLYLTESDSKYGVEGEPTYVTIKQARQSEQEARMQLFSTLERRYGAAETGADMTLIQTINMEQITRLEVYLTLCESNITDDKGEPLFPSRKSKADQPQLSLSRPQFEKIWGELPTDVCREIHEKVLEVNPQWGGDSGED